MDDECGTNPIYSLHLFANPSATSTLVLAVHGASGRQSGTQGCGLQNWTVFMRN